MYQIILKDGSMTGEYSDKKSPAEVARAIMKTLHIKTGVKTKEIRFKNIKTGREYTYNAHIVILERPITIHIKGKKFLEKYKIFVKRK